MFPNSISGLTWWNQYSNPSFLNLSGDDILSVIDGAYSTTNFQTQNGNRVRFQNDIYPASTGFSGGTLGTGKMSSLNGQYSATTDFTIFTRYIFTGSASDDVICSSDSGGGFANGELYDGTQVPYRWFQNKIQGSSIEYNFWADPNTASGFQNVNLTLTSDTWINQAVRVYQDGPDYKLEVWVNDVLVASNQTNYTAVAAVIAPGIIVASNFRGSVAEQFWFNKKLDSSELTQMFNYLIQRYEAPDVTPTPTPTPTNTPSVTPTNTETPTNTPTNTQTPSVTPTTPPPSPTPSSTPKEVNFKTIASDFQILANFHKQLNSFGLGDIDQLTYWNEQRLKETNEHYQSPYYPLLYVVPSKVENDLQYKVWEFNTTVSDIVEDSLQNNEDTLSDTLQILQDVISQFRWSTTNVLGNYYDKYWVDDDVQCTPYLGEEDDNLNGWNGLLRIKTMTALDRCAAAFREWTGSSITHPDGINLKTFTDDFRILSDYHKQIQSFGFGKMDEFTYWNEMRLKENNTHFNSPYYPYFYVIPQDVIQKFGFMEYKFTFITSDIIQRDLANQVDVLSDTLQIMDDILGQFRLSVYESLGNFNELYYLNTPITCVPFLEKYDDLLGGWVAEVTIEVKTPLDRCDAPFEPWTSPTPTATPTGTPEPTNTPTNTETPTQTPTTTPTPTCPVTTQYLEVQLQDNTKFKLILWNQPDFTSPATANCDYIISGAAYGSLGTVYYGQETIDVGQHQHQFNLAPVLQPGETVVAFDVFSYTLSGCPCPVNLILPVGPTPTPTPTTTQTPTPTNTMTPTQTGTGVPEVTPTQTTSPTPSSTPYPLPETPALWYDSTNTGTIDLISSGGTNYVSVWRSAGVYQKALSGTTTDTMPIYSGSSRFPNNPNIVRFTKNNNAALRDVLSQRFDTTFIPQTGFTFFEVISNPVGGNYVFGGPAQFLFPVQLFSGTTSGGFGSPAQLVQAFNIGAVGNGIVINSVINGINTSNQLLNMSARTLGEKYLYVQSIGFPNQPLPFELNNSASTLSTLITGTTTAGFNAVVIGQITTATGILNTTFNAGAEVAEIMVYNRVLNSTEIDQVQNYLRDKWNYNQW